MNVFCLQENYFGAYQIYKDFDARSLSKIKRTVTSQDAGGGDISIEDVDPLSLRPMEANILVNLCSIRAELTQVYHKNNIWKGKKNAVLCLTPLFNNPTALHVLQSLIVFIHWLTAKNLFRLIYSSVPMN